MKRMAHIILIICFLIVLYSPHLIWHFAEEMLRGENKENRMLAAAPEFSMDKIDTYPTEYEKYYNDNMPFRSQLIALYNRVRYHFFHTSSNSRVVLGRDGWLFLDDPNDGNPIACYDGSRLFKEDELKIIASNLLEARNKLAEIGSEFVLFIAPNKERVYYEYMPAYLGEPSKQCMVNQLVSYLKEHTDIRVVYPYESLMDYKKKHPEQMLYHKTDTHWNFYGGYIGARELLAELGIEYPTLDCMKTSVVKGGSGDLARMLSLSDHLEKEFEVKVHGYAFGEAVELENVYHGAMVYEMPDLKERKLFVRRDSFCDNMLPYLNSSFSDSKFVHTRGYLPEMVWEYKPDVYVLETVERYIRGLMKKIL